MLSRFDSPLITLLSRRRTPSLNATCLSWINRCTPAAHPMTPTSLKADQLPGEGGSVVDSRRLDCLHMAHVASGCGRGC